MAVRLTILKDRETWLEHRKLGLGGSDIASVIGKNPWKSNQELWREKVGIKPAKDLSGNEWVQYGHDAEPLLRSLFALDFPEYEVIYTENNSYRNDKYPWALASVDGLLKDRERRLGILEIKTSNIIQPYDWDKWRDKIPDNYYCQVLFYMAVLEADFAVLKAQLRRRGTDGLRIKTNHYFMERSEVEEDIKYLMSAGEKFWESVKERKEPALILPEI